jgi:hypothetical protein
MLSLIGASREVCQSRRSVCLFCGPSSSEDSKFKKHSIVARKHAFALLLRQPDTQRAR